MTLTTTIHTPLRFATLAAAVAVLGACSSSGPAGTTATTANDGSHPASTGAAVDQYGYQFESDSPQQAAAAGTSAPAQATNAQGRLAPEAIQSVVRQSFGAFRTCYESGLQKDAQLTGTVTVSFIIAPDGSVQSPADHGSTMPDAGVVGCVVSGFGKLAFPPPQGGYVSVVYPLVFSPNG